MNLLITGEMGAGKSTLVNQVMQRHPGPFAGFRSFRTPRIPGLEAYVYLTDINHPETHYTLAHFKPGGQRLFYPEVFDNTAAGILHRIQPEFGGLVVMDEIGRMENDSLAFQAAVERLLLLEIPVLATLRQDDTAFLKKLYAWPDATLIHLEPHNREEKLALALEHLGIP